MQVTDPLGRREARLSASAIWRPVLRGAQACASDSVVPATRASLKFERGSPAGGVACAPPRTGHSLHTIAIQRSRDFAIYIPIINEKRQKICFLIHTHI